MATFAQKLADGLGITYMRDLGRFAHAHLRHRLRHLEAAENLTPARRSYLEQLRSLNRQPRNARGMSAAGLDGRMSGGLPTMPTHPDTAVRSTLRTLRARSRHQAANDPYARKILREFCSNVVGPQGVRVVSLATDPDGTPDDKAREAIEKGWTAWCRRGCCDVTGGRSFADVQRVYITGLVQDGEALVRKWHGRNWNKYGFALQCVDAELLDVELDASLPDEHHVRMSIELDPWERPVAYYLSELAGGPSLLGYGYTPVRRHRVDAEHLIHGYLPDMPGQTRGLPLLSPVLLRMAMLAGYEDAAVMAARIGASKMGFFTSQTGENYTGQAKDSDGALFMDVEPGTFEQLPEGVDFKGWDPKYPDGDFQPFVSAILRGMASGSGVPYHTLAQDPAAANYSSLRAFAIEARQVWQLYQEHLVQALVWPVFEAWLRTQLAAGTLRVGRGQLNPSNLEKYLQVEFRAQTWEWVDPLKETQGHVMQIENGLATPQDIIRKSGRDPEKVVAELAKWQEMLEAAGVSLDVRTPMVVAAEGKE